MFIATHLVGFGARRRAAVALTLTQVLSSTSTSNVIAFPGGILAGDLIVLFDSSFSSGLTPSAVVPSGFTEIVNANGGSDPFMRNICSYKIAVGTESGNLTGMASTARKAMVVFRGSSAITAVSALDTAGQVTSSDPTDQTVDAAAGVAPLIVFGAYAADESGSTISPRTFNVGISDVKDGEVNPNSFCYLAWKIYNTAPANVSIDMQDEALDVNGLQSFYLQVS